MRARRPSRRRRRRPRRTDAPAGGSSSCDGSRGRPGPAPSHVRSSAEPRRRRHSVRRATRRGPVVTGTASFVRIRRPKPTLGVPPEHCPTVSGAPSARRGRVELVRRACCVHFSVRGCVDSIGLPVLSRPGAEHASVPSIRVPVHSTALLLEAAVQALRSLRRAFAPRSSRQASPSRPRRWRHRSPRTLASPLLVARRHSRSRRRRSRSSVERCRRRSSSTPPASREDTHRRPAARQFRAVGTVPARRNLFGAA